jgi:hypothetical protein
VGRREPNPASISLSPRTRAAASKTSKIPAAHNINSLLYEYQPEICDRIRKRGDEVVGHGRTNAERQGDLWELDERRLIDDVTQEFIQREGRPPKGWMGPAASESNVTPDLLKEAGYQYVMDWPADDQPFWLKTRAGPLLSIPYPAELNDSAAIIIHRDGTARDFGDMIVDGFDEMVEQCEKQPLVMTISLHPFVMGSRSVSRHCARRSSTVLSTADANGCGGRRRARSPTRATGCDRGPSRAKARKFDAAVSGPARFGFYEGFPT